MTKETRYKDMRPQTAIQKGKILESYLADQIVAKGLDDKATRSIGSGSGNREKADINTKLTILGRNVGFECKNYKNAHVKDWFNQAKKLEQIDREPIVVYKLGGESLADSKAIIYVNTLLDLIKQANLASGEVLEDTGVQQNDKWIIKSGVEILKKIIKVLEKYI